VHEREGQAQRVRARDMLVSFDLDLMARRAKASDTGHSSRTPWVFLFPAPHEKLIAAGGDFDGALGRRRRILKRGCCLSRWACAGIGCAARRFAQGGVGKGAWEGRHRVTAAPIESCDSGGRPLTLWSGAVGSAGARDQARARGLPLPRDKVLPLEVRTLWCAEGQTRRVPLG